MITEKDILHKEYLNICENVTINGLENYNIKQLLYNEAYYAQNTNNKSLFKFTVLNLIFDVRFLVNMEITRKNDELIMLSTKWNRKDHDGYWEQICDVFPEHTRISFSSVSGKSKIKYLRLFSFFSNSRELRVIKKAFRQIKNKQHRNYIANRVLVFKKILNYIELQNLNPKVAMCFFDSGFYENLLMQYFKNKGAITVTNQHGQPVFKSAEYDRMNQSQILNFKCDYFLAKGEFTRKQFVNAGFDADRVKVIGSFNNCSDIKASTEVNKVFCTFLNCIALPNADTVNKKLLEISAELSKRLGYSFYVKIHPSDNIANYADFKPAGLIDVVGKEITIPEISERIGFGIFNESAVYLDLLSSGVRSYRWDNGTVFPLVEDDESIFTELEEIEKFHKEWLSLSDSEKEKYFENISEHYNGKFGADKEIKTFITNIMINGKEQ